MISPPALIERGRAHLARVICEQVSCGTLSTKSLDKGIYDLAKDLLWKLQHAKCCFCERSYERAFSSVEHFRPKAKAHRCDVEVLGYWWLAYELENLWFCCMNCNTSKGTQFPLEPGSAPLTPCKRPSPLNERPLLLDPAHDDPSQHISFKMVGQRIVPQPLAGSTRGEVTIRTLKLDRDDLSEFRYKHYSERIRPVIERHRDAVKRQDGPAIVAAVLDAKTLVDPSSEFSLTARVFLKQANVPF
ncbi:MAG: hypothetical protein U0165_11500 [Polyangiaceae bacterium]